jgi:hypothetical protein
MNDAKPNRRKRSPPEDKRLSYELDRRNIYGENAKSSRKAIQRFKADSSRRGRHGVSQTLAAAGPGYDERDEARLVERANKSRHPWKRKFPDQPLGIVIAHRNAKRISGEGAKARRAAARTARLEST